MLLALLKLHNAVFLLLALQTAAAGVQRTAGYDTKNSPETSLRTTSSSGKTATVHPPAPTRRAELVRRDESDVCGYVNGRGDLPWTCPGDQPCELHRNLGVAGCCYSQPCIITSVCYDYAEGEKGACDAGKIGVGTSCCVDSKYPYCQTYTYPDEEASLVWCGATSPTGLQTLLYQPDSISVAQTVNGSSTSPHTDTPSPKSSKTSATTAAGVSTTAAPVSSDSADGGGGGSGLSQDNQIALGIGLGFGLPTTLVSLYLCYRKLGRKGKPKTRAIYA
ncbi:hypothetical protein NLU13_7049 [Sarocladium strictum]|uniref:Uncharacterized protein n=1 Tax=Sarocladium strictum TaxID=5046 RepID=A0AA39GGW0_SARSR|nr:hypothetical protein NLU13_7049 [Sarocladium strictum]